MKRLSGLALAAALVATPAAAATAEEDARLDIRCVAISLAMMASGDQTLAPMGLMSMFFFAGRAEGRNPGKDIMEIAAEDAASMTSAQREATAKICGQILIDKGQEWQEKGAQMEMREKAGERGL